MIDSSEPRSIGHRCCISLPLVVMSSHRSSSIVTSDIALLTCIDIERPDRDINRVTSLRFWHTLCLYNVTISLVATRFALTTCREPIFWLISNVVSRVEEFRRHSKLMIAFSIVIVHSLVMGKETVSRLAILLRRTLLSMYTIDEDTLYKRALHSYHLGMTCRV